MHMVNFNSGSATPIMDAAGTPQFGWLEENEGRKKKFAPYVDLLASKGYVMDDLRRRQFECLASNMMLETTASLESSRNGFTRMAFMNAVNKERADAAREKRPINESAILDLATGGMMLSNLGIMGVVWASQMVSEIFGTQILPQVNAEVFYRNPVTSEAQTVDGYTYPAGMGIHQNIYRTGGAFNPDYYTTARGETIKKITNTLTHEQFMAEAYKIRHENPVEDIFDLYKMFGVALEGLQDEDCIQHLLRIFDYVAWTTSVGNIPAANVETFAKTGYTSSDYDYEAFTARSRWPELLWERIAALNEKVQKFTNGGLLNVAVGNTTSLGLFTQMSMLQGSNWMVTEPGALAMMRNGADAMSGGFLYGTYANRIRVYCAYDWPYDDTILFTHKNFMTPYPFYASGFAGIYTMGYKTELFTNPENLTTTRAFMDRWVFKNPGETKNMLAKITLT